jgi:hypothetical protein
MLRSVRLSSDCASSLRRGRLTRHGVVCHGTRAHDTKALHRCYRYQFYREAARNLRWGDGNRAKLPPLIEHLAKNHWPSVSGTYTGFKADPTVTGPEGSAPPAASKPKRQRQ